MSKPDAINQVNSKENSLKATRLFYAGCVLAILLPIAVMIPYSQATQSLRAQSGQLNVAASSGNNSFYAIHFQSPTPTTTPATGLPINFTLSASYPKAVSDNGLETLFSLQLNFTISLGAEIDHLTVWSVGVLLPPASLSCVISTNPWQKSPTGPLATFDRTSKTGPIPAYNATISMPIESYCLPQPQYQMQPLEFTDQLNLYPTIGLSGETATNVKNSTGYWNFTEYGFGTGFDLVEHSVTVYRFNQPPSVWVAFSISAVALLMIGVLQLDHHASRRNLTHLTILLFTASVILALGVYQFYH